MTAIPPQEVFDHPRLVPALVVAASLGALAVALVAQHWGGIEPCVFRYCKQIVFIVKVEAFGEVAAEQRPGHRPLAAVLAGEEDEAVRIGRVGRARDPLKIERDAVAFGRALDVAEAGAGAVPPAELLLGERAPRQAFGR